MVKLDLFKTIIALLIYSFIYNLALGRITIKLEEQVISIFSLFLETLFIKRINFKVLERVVFKI